MNFPDNPLFRLLYWIINTPGIGGITVLLVGGGSVTMYLLTLRWISRGSQADEPDVYTFPTSTLLGHESEHDE